MDEHNKKTVTYWVITYELICSQITKKRNTVAKWHS